MPAELFVCFPGPGGTTFVAFSAHVRKMEIISPSEVGLKLAVTLPTAEVCFHTPERKRQRSTISRLRVSLILSR